MSDVPSFNDSEDDIPAQEEPSFQPSFEEESISFEEESISFEEESIEPVNILTETKEPGSSTKWAVLACLLMGICIAGAFYLSGVLLPKQGPEAQVLLTDAKQAVESNKSAEFNGEFKLVSASLFLQNSMGDVKFDGKFNDKDLEINFVTKSNVFNIINKPDGFYFKSKGSAWIKIPYETGNTSPFKKGTEDVFGKNDAELPSFNFLDVNGYVNEGDDINEEKTWRLKPELTSLLKGKDIGKVLPLLSTVVIQADFSQKTSLPLAGEFEWSLEPWMIDNLEDSEDGGLKTVKKYLNGFGVTGTINFDKWGTPIEIKTPKAKSLTLNRLGKKAEDGVSKEIAKENGEE